MKAWADEILVDMRAGLSAAYSERGRPGIPPEQLLNAMLLRAIYSIPRDRRLMEAVEFNILYRWFLDLALRQLQPPRRIIICRSVRTGESFARNQRRPVRRNSLVRSRVAGRTNLA